MLAVIGSSRRRWPHNTPNAGIRYVTARVFARSEATEQAEIQDVGNARAEDAKQHRADPAHEARRGLRPVENRPAEAEARSPRSGCRSRSRRDRRRSAASSRSWPRCRTGPRPTDPRAQPGHRRRSPTDSLPHTSTSTPANPTISPAIRAGAGLSRSQTNATSAPKSGAVELSTEANPAVTERTA